MQILSTAIELRAINRMWQPQPSEIYYYCQFWSHGLFSVVVGYTPAKYD